MPTRRSRLQSGMGDPGMLCKHPVGGLRIYRVSTLASGSHDQHLFVMCSHRVRGGILAISSQRSGGEMFAFGGTEGNAEELRDCQIENPIVLKVLPFVTLQYGCDEVLGTLASAIIGRGLGTVRRRRCWTVALPETCDFGCQ